MDPTLEKATRELFAGNRSEVLRLLQGRGHQPYEIWLLACATDDDDTRQRLLSLVRSSGEQPYANLAKATLEREADFDRQMHQAPRWQTWLLERRDLLIRMIIAVVVLVGTIIIGGSVVIPPSPDPAVVALTTVALATVQTHSATATAIARTPTVTPTQPELDAGSRPSITYGNVGSLTVVSIERATGRRIGGARGSTPIPPPQDAEYVAIEYDFVCGKAQAICDNPPEAAIRMRVADNSLPEIPALTDVVVLDSPLPPPVAAGSTVRGWLVFAVPRGQIPAKLLIQIQADSRNPTPQIFELVLPRS